MSHPEQRAFFEIASAANRAALASSRVLEIGSYDVNGTVRDIIGAGEHIGCDLKDGPGVDVIGYGHQLAYPDASFDMTFSGECFEHDPHWRDTFTNMVRMTRPGGLVLFTCASRGRLEHGTVRTDPMLSPGTQSRGFDYYRNLNRSDFDGMPDEWFSESRFWRQSVSCDLYFAGVRRGAPPAFVLPEDVDVDAIASESAPRGERLLRAPLRAVSYLPDRLYQTIALAYLPRVLDARVAVRRRFPSKRVADQTG